MTRHDRIAVIACFPLLLVGLSAGSQDGVQPSPVPGPEETEAEDGKAAAPEPVDEQVPVADDDLAAVSGESTEAPEAPPVETKAEELIREFTRFKELMANESLDAADLVAKRIVELTINVTGPRSTETAKALTNLAIVQHRNKQLDAAQQNYESAIDIIEDVEDRLNEQLVNPLKGLAAAQLDSGRPDLASTTYNRAVHVTHVNEGPHNLDQIGLLEDLSEVQLRMGELDRAREIQDRIYALNIRTYEQESMELVPALLRRASWQHRAGLIFDERTTYRRAIRIIEDEKGKDDLALVEPLVRLGRSFFFIDTTGQQTYQQVSMASGEIYFKRALRIAAESPDSNWDIVADATLALGDYYMFEGNTQNARQVYGTAWNLLSEVEDSAAKLDRRFRELETPVLLRSRNLPAFVGETDPTIVRIPDDPTLEGTVTVTYRISAHGRAEDLQLVEAVPPDFTGMQKMVQREIRRRMYRPTFRDGEPVDSPPQLFIHNFHYRQSDLATLRGTDHADAERT